MGIFDTLEPIQRIATTRTQSIRYFTLFYNHGCSVSVSLLSYLHFMDLLKNCGLFMPYIQMILLTFSIPAPNKTSSSDRLLL